MTSTRSNRKCCGDAGQFVLQGMVNLADETQVNLLVDRRQELYRAVRVSIANLNPPAQGQCLDRGGSEGRQHATRCTPRCCRKSGNWCSRRPPAEPSRAAGGGRSGWRHPDGPPDPSSRGLVRMDLIGTDLRLLDLVLELYAIGRVDIAADNPFWVKDGRLTSDGRAVLAALQERHVVVHLDVAQCGPAERRVRTRPRSRLRSPVRTRFPTTHWSAFASRGILWGVNFDPKACRRFPDARRTARSRDSANAGTCSRS